MNNNFNEKALCEFLVEAKKNTYASGDSAIKKINSDESTTLVYEKNDWKYHDNYFGGEPYGGREVVFYKNKPVYIMVYYGQVNKEVKDVKKIYITLMNALKRIPEKKPYRGPKEFIDGELKYLNYFEGNIDNFHGEEKIEENGKELYNARYIGGFVDVRK